MNRSKEDEDEEEQIKMKVLEVWDEKWIKNLKKIEVKMRKIKKITV